MENETKVGRIKGKPTLLAIYSGRLPADSVLGALQSVEYPLDDVAVYYRLEGTDQVIDAVTGKIAAGQSLNEVELSRKDSDKVDTLVLMHPPADRFPAVRSVLNGLGSADIKYADETNLVGTSGVGPAEEVT